MKSVIVVQGKSNVGKTSTINLIWEMLCKSYPNRVLVWSRRSKREIGTIIDIDKVRLGIESQGDPGHQLPESIKRFVDEKCDVILCTSRTYGATTDVIEALAPQYRIEWVAKGKAPKGVSEEDHNKQAAAIVFAKLQQAIADARNG